MSGDSRGPQHPGPEREPPRYRIAVGKGPAPAGWVYILNENLSEARSLLVPERVGRALICWSQGLWEERERAAIAVDAVDQNWRANKSSADEAKAGASASGFTRSRTKPSSQVNLPDPALFDEPAPSPSGCWVRIWKPEHLLPLVERHNAGDGSADKSDRERNAAAWQAQVDAGPWRVCAKPVDPDRALAELRAELGHLPALCDHIEDRLVLACAEGKPFTVPPILLVGSAGIGKSHAARRVAEILGLPIELLDMSRQQTNGRLHGADKHWANATAGLLRQLVIGGKAANPVVVLDEIDKTPRGGSSAHYDPLGPLHGALEPATAAQTEDQCIPGVFDASLVIYIATANTLAPIPTSLLSRFLLVLCIPPGPRQALATARRIADEVTSKLPRFKRPGRVIVAALADRTPREMRQLLEAAVARAVKAGRRHLELRDLGLDGRNPKPLH